MLPSLAINFNMYNTIHVTFKQGYIRHNWIITSINCLGANGEVADWSLSCFAIDSDQSGYEKTTKLFQMNFAENQALKLTAKKFKLTVKTFVKYTVYRCMDSFSNVRKVNSNVLLLFFFPLFIDVNTFRY